MEPGELFLGRFHQVRVVRALLKPFQGLDDLAQIKKVVAVLSVIEGMGVSDVEIHQTRYSSRVMGSHGAEFFAPDGVADEYGSTDLQSVKYSNHIVSKSLCAVAPCGP